MRLKGTDKLNDQGSAGGRDEERIHSLRAAKYTHRVTDIQREADRETY